MLFLHLLQSVQNLPRVEHLIFQAFDNVEVTFLSSVQTDHELVVVAKQRISAVALNNSHGPNRYLLFCSY